MSFPIVNIPHFLPFKRITTINTAPVTAVPSLLIINMVLVDIFTQVLEHRFYISGVCINCVSRPANKLLLAKNSNGEITCGHISYCKMCFDNEKITICPACEGQVIADMTLDHSADFGKCPFCVHTGTCKRNHIEL